MEDSLTIEVLVSTMYRANCDFLERMNISTDVVVVNQCDNESRKTYEKDGITVTQINTLARGLSNSRNMCLLNSRADICVLADDDVVFKDNFEQIVQAAYRTYSNADIIAFQVARIGNVRPKTFRKRMHWENYISSMKISSVEITFRRKKIIDSGIRFNPLLGAGAKYYMGEESDFLYKCLRKKMKILYLPVIIAGVDCSDSTWFKGYTQDYFISKGAAYYSMSNHFYWALILQFALRHKNLFAERCTVLDSIKYMLEGVRQYKHERY